jgi:hypothetical protein
MLFYDLGHLVHGRKWEPATVLALCQIEQRNNTRFLVVGCSARLV